MLKNRSIALNYAKDLANWVKRAFLLMPALYLPFLSPAQISIMVGTGVGSSLQPAAPIEPNLRMDEYVSVNSAFDAFEGSLGTGIQSRVRVAYDYSPYIKADIDVAYFAGFSSSSMFDSMGVMTSSTSIKSPRLQLTPGITISMGERRFSPFLRVGTIIPSRYRISYHSTTPRANGQLTQMINLKATTTLGGQGSLGISYRIDPRIRFFYEVSYIHQKARPLYSQVEAYDINGEGQLHTLSTYQMETIYREGGEFLMNHPDNPDFDPSMPLEIATPTRDAKLLTMNLGVIFSIR